MSKPFVYVASPYTKGDTAVNVRAQCEAFDKLLNDDLVVPYVPLWSHFQHLVFPRKYQDWIAYDNQWIAGKKFDACLRINAELHTANMQYFEDKSSGADAEVKLFESLGLPVFYNYEDLYHWTHIRNREPLAVQR